MKSAFKYTALVFCILTFFAENLYAAPSNGTRFPEAKGVEIGYEFNSLFRRPLDRSYGNLTSQNNFLIASFGVTDRFTLDAKVGLGNVTQKGGIHLPKIEYNTGFSGGYGFRFKLLDHEKTGIRIIAGAQHISVHPADRSVDNDKFESFLDDWQVSSIISVKVKGFSPYAGMKLSDCEIVYNINKHDKKRRFSENHIGFIFGSDIYLFRGKLRVNIEGRLFDENALSTAVAYLF